MTLDITKLVQTRDGRKARIICMDADPDVPIVAVVGGKAYQYTATGLLGSGIGCGPLDLVNVSQRVERWACIYGVDSQRAYLYSSRDKAKTASIFSVASGLIKLIFENNKLVSVEIDKGE